MIKILSKVSDKDKELLEDLFNYVPELKESIEKKLLEYIEYNENHFTSYLTKTRMEDMAILDNTRLLDPEDMGAGELPLVAAIPEYIVPTPGHRTYIGRVVERPVEKLGFEPDRESEKKLQTDSSDHSIESKESVAFFSEYSDRYMPYTVVPRPGQSDSTEELSFGKPKIKADDLDLN